MNYYGTDQYQQNLKLLDEQVFSKIKFDEPDRVKELDFGYYIEYYYYADEENCLPGHAAVDGEICRLYKSGKFVFQWKNTDGRSRMAKIIHHSNGNDYLVFDEDLYGYSVLDLQDLNCLHYLPAESYGKYPEEFEETFIWCDCFYNPQTDMLAVEGCYWACPGNIIVLNFSRPMIAVEPEQWTDIYQKYCDSYPDLGDIDFEKWDGSNLVFKASFLNNATKPAVITMNYESIRRRKVGKKK